MAPLDEAKIAYSRGIERSKVREKRNKEGGSLKVRKRKEKREKERARLERKEKEKQEKNNGKEEKKKTEMEEEEKKEMEENYRGKPYFHAWFKLGQS